MPYNPQFLQAQRFTRGEAFSFDPNAFLDAIRSQGVELIHYRAMACPVGLVDKSDTTHRVHFDHPNCFNGYRYSKQGKVTSLFVGNVANPDPQDQGSLDGSTVQCTMPREYDDGRPLYLAPFDRLYFADEGVLWPNWEVLEHNIAGVDRLRFPAECAPEIVDNRNVTYEQEVDYTVVDGRIRWLDGGKRPGVDMDTDRGRVITVWYLYRPYFYVSRLGHDGRVTQYEDENGERKVHRMPFQAQLTREIVHENKLVTDDETKPSNSDMPHSSDGSLPPR